MQYNPDDYVTVDEAAALTGYHPEYIRRLARDGIIAARKWGGSWMIERQSILVYHGQTKPGPKSETPTID